MVSEDLLTLILLDFVGDLNAWLSARVLNKACLAITKIKTQKVEAKSWGSLGIVCYNRCGSCNEVHQSLDWLNYHTNIAGNKRCVIPYCQKWVCKIDVLKSMLESAKLHGKRILMEPWSQEVSVEIPRPEKRDKDGNITRPAFFSSGFAATRWVNIIAGRACAHCEWMCPSTNTQYYKCVQLEDLGFTGEIKPVTIFD